MDLGSLIVGCYIVIDNEPCRIVSYDHSKPGKHGSAKARVSAIGVFDGSKHGLVSPVSAMSKFHLLTKGVDKLYQYLVRLFKLWILKPLKFSKPLQ
jgi:translation initiation factor 5A